MSIIGTIIIGFLIGILAKLLHPGKENMGFIVTTLLGIGGSVVASQAGRFLGFYEPGQTAGWIASIIGAIVLLAIYGAIKGKSAGS